MVSNEDREAAVRILLDRFPLSYDNDLAKQVWADIYRGSLDALVSHGWGPKPAVDAQRLNDLVTACTMGITLSPLTDYLEQAGIEVTYD